MHDLALWIPLEMRGAEGILSSGIFLEMIVIILDFRDSRFFFDILQYIAFENKLKHTKSR